MKLILNLTQEEYNALMHYTKENVGLTRILDQANFEARMREAVKSKNKARELRKEQVQVVETIVK